MKINKLALTESFDDSTSAGWVKKQSKVVADIDGFMTDYTWYFNPSTGKHIFMIGDSDIYEPDEAYADWEAETEEEAQEWFDNYETEAFDDTLDESASNNSSTPNKYKFFFCTGEGARNRHRMDDKFTQIRSFESNQLAKEYAAKTVSKMAWAVEGYERGFAEEYLDDIDFTDGSPFCSGIQNITTGEWIYGSDYDLDEKVSKGYLKEDFNTEDIENIILVVHPDETEDFSYTDSYQADSHFQELSDMSDDELKSKNIIGFSQLQRNEDDSFVISDKYTLNQEADNSIREYIDNNLKECVQDKKSLKEDWDDFDKFEEIISRYMPAHGEGEFVSQQLATAVNKLIYKWFNDGDVFDNTYALEGWANDLSSYANWLYKNVPEVKAELREIEDCKTEEDYEELLMDLATKALNSELLDKYENVPKQGSIYDCNGPFEFVDRTDEEEEDEYLPEDDFEEDIEEGLNKTLSKKIPKDVWSGIDGLWSNARKQYDELGYAPAGFHYDSATKDVWPDNPDNWEGFGLNNSDFENDDDSQYYRIDAFGEAKAPEGYTYGSGVTAIVKATSYNSAIEKYVKSDVYKRQWGDRDSSTLDIKAKLANKFELRLGRQMNKIVESRKLVNDELLTEAPGDFNPLSLKKYGVVRDPGSDFSDDGNRFTGYVYKGVPITYLKADGQVYLTIAFHHLDDLSFHDYSKFTSYKDSDKYNGVGANQVDINDFMKILEQAKKDIDEFRANVKPADKTEFEAYRKRWAEYYSKAAELAKKLIIDNFDAFVNLEAYNAKIVVEYYKHILSDIQSNTKEYTGSEMYMRDVLRPESIASQKAKIENGYSDYYWYSKIEEIINKARSKKESLEEKLTSAEFVNISQDIADELSDFLNAISDMPNQSDYFDEYDMKALGDSMDCLYDAARAAHATIYSEALKEGTWSTPFTTQQANKLAELMQNKLTVADKDALYDLVGDDKVFDEIDNCAADEDIRPIIKKHLSKILTELETFKTQPEKDALEILKTLAENKELESCIEVTFNKEDGKWTYEGDIESDKEFSSLTQAVSNFKQVCTDKFACDNINFSKLEKDTDGEGYCVGAVMSATCSNTLTEGRMSEIDIEIQEAGGLTKYKECLQKEIAELTTYLNSDAVNAKLVNAGGNFDSDEERQQVLIEVKKQLSELQAKLNYVNTL